MIRPAQPRDRAALLAFTRDTFAWGDYIDAVWDEWLADPAGRVLVADEPGHGPVAMARVRLLNAAEAWLEGMRVHPAHRRRGWADALNHELCRWAEARGANVARLAIEAGNTPALRQAERLGWEPKATFVYLTPGIGSSGDGHRAAAAQAPPQTAPPPTESQRQAWGHGEQRATAAGLIARGWAWRTMRWADVTAGGETGRLLSHASGAYALLEEGDPSRIAWIDGPSNAWPTLLEVAAEPGGSAMLPANAAVRLGAEAAGLEIAAVMIVSERRLDTSQ